MKARAELLAELNRRSPAHITFVAPAVLPVEVLAGNQTLKLHNVVGIHQSSPT